ncbi:CLUMA_CG001864, isoform A [Clunio marinus]|uniref:CLUMA_CG001864, isoform A n=1 Tax=Clunio marinus TaxID=568069 RepID=A0A1J1HJ80_9DIPT|nr:CLUMA_CG001864, isoform A [Clunio marinus]
MQLQRMYEIILMCNAHWGFAIEIVTQLDETSKEGIVVNKSSIVSKSVRQAINYHWNVERMNSNKQKQRSDNHHQDIHRLDSKCVESQFSQSKLYNELNS